ncbi:MAG: hypothetical protein ACRELY_09035 [Polyangiaceae bacterium]
MNYLVHKSRRDGAYVTTENLVNADPSVRAPVALGPIDRVAIAAWKATWELNPARSVDWDWADYAAGYRRKRYARLELAIWSGDALCGFALGKFSRAARVLQLNFIEGAPGNPLKGSVLWIAIAHGIILGSGYRAGLFRVTKPANHVQIALSLLNPPFTYVAASAIAPYDYCERSLP